MRASALSKISWSLEARGPGVRGTGAGGGGEGEAPALWDGWVGAELGSVDMVSFFRWFLGLRWLESSIESIIFRNLGPFRFLGRCCSYGCWVMEEWLIDGIGRRAGRRAGINHVIDKDPGRRPEYLTYSAAFEYLSGNLCRHTYISGNGISLKRIVLVLVVRCGCAGRMKS